MGASLAAISPQDMEHTKQTAEELGLSYFVLSDMGNETAREYGLAYQFDEALIDAYKTLGMNLEEYNGDNPWALPIPAVYIIDPSGKVAHVFADSDYTNRMEPAAMLKELERAAS